MAHQTSASPSGQFMEVLARLGRQENAPPEGVASVRAPNALLDYLVESAPDHRLFRSAIDQARARYVPGLVLAELDDLPLTLRFKPLAARDARCSLAAESILAPGHGARGATGMTVTNDSDHGLARSRNRSSPIWSPALGRPVAR